MCGCSVLKSPQIEKPRGVLKTAKVLISMGTHPAESALAEWCDGEFVIVVDSVHEEPGQAVDDDHRPQQHAHLTGHGHRAVTLPPDRVVQVDKPETQTLNHYCWVSKLLGSWIELVYLKKKIIYGGIILENLPEMVLEGFLVFFF